METAAYEMEVAQGRKPPIIIPPTSAPADISKQAAFIFLHGLGDEAEGVESLSHVYIHHQP